MIQQSYDKEFGIGCNNFEHYLDAAMYKLDGLQETHMQQDQEYSAVHDDLFMSTGYYSNPGDIDIIFDSGCTTSVTPHEHDFIGPINRINKNMQGLGATATATGEGIVKWKFRDDYGVE